METSGAPRRARGLNQKARVLEMESGAEVEGYACSDCCTSYAPGWEVDPGGVIDPCSGGWQVDLPLCYTTCFWTGQVADDTTYPSWMNACSSAAQDWRMLCVIPD